MLASWYNWSAPFLVSMSQQKGLGRRRLIKAVSARSDRRAWASLFCGLSDPVDVDDGASIISVHWSSGSELCSLSGAVALDVPGFDPHHCLLTLSKSEGSFIGEKRQPKSPRLVLLGVEFCKTWSRREGDSGESGGPCSQEFISESAWGTLECGVPDSDAGSVTHFVWEVEVEAMAVSWRAFAMFSKASSISSDRLPRLANDTGRRGMARRVSCGSIFDSGWGLVTPGFRGFIITKIGVVSLDLSPAALWNLDGEPVNIERFEKTIEYSRPIEENKGQYERSDDPIIQELL